MIQVNELQKTYGAGGKNEVRAVKGISLNVRKGEIFGLLGPNGAGKSTTMRMLATLLKPTGGNAVIAGRDLFKDPNGIRARIGYVGQHGGSKGWATAIENMVFQGRLYGLGKAGSAAAGRQLARALDLEEVCDRPVKTYSGGQKRKVDLALGLIHGPDLLYLDEPTTGLDPQSRAQFWQYIRTVREQGKTIFLSTHYLDEADALCDRVAIVDHGLLQAEGTPDQLKKQVGGDIITLHLQESGAGQDVAACAEELKRAAYVVRVQQEEGLLRLFVRPDDEAFVQSIRTVDRFRLRTDRVSHSRPTLDDVFLQYTGRSLRTE